MFGRKPSDDPVEDWLVEPFDDAGGCLIVCAVLLVALLALGFIASMIIATYSDAFRTS